MFVIELTYKTDLSEIDAHMAAHVVFLKKYYAAGNFLVSGRKIPRDGGIILAVGKSRSHAFMTRLESISGGSVTVSSTATIGGETVTVDEVVEYDPSHCG